MQRMIETLVALAIATILASSPAWGDDLDGLPT